MKVAMEIIPEYKAKGGRWLRLSSEIRDISRYIKEKNGKS